jgi:hypothetical protein
MQAINYSPRMSPIDHTQHLKELAAFFADSKTCRDSFRLLIHFAIRLAAAGHTTEVLAVVLRSAEPDLFLPLADGLRLHLGIPLTSPEESRALALQIAAKITDEVAAHDLALPVA